MAAARDLAGNQPGSTRVCVGEDVALSDVTGVYDRDDSLKENTNPKCIIVKNCPGHKAGNGAAQRFPGNLKPTAAPIIGISGNLGQGCARRHRPPAMFPKNSRRVDLPEKKACKMRIEFEENVHNIKRIFENFEKCSPNSENVHVFQKMYTISRNVREYENCS
ncbi:unnamed protein product [Triticum turgidum subsp. durum]|uniref:Uncharacterized protein n=1 Tax=Triticum turgidum subsp. durum TaxID=4567 RepID=A0A9R0TNA6_TRITD|nr:unnamed protein product [Triticum turgidum subsp. durum]